jgi:hypothetical protein
MTCYEILYFKRDIVCERRFRESAIHWSIVNVQQKVLALNEGMLTACKGERGIGRPESAGARNARTSDSILPTPPLAFLPLDRLRLPLHPRTLSRHQP